MLVFASVVWFQAAAPAAARSLRDSVDAALRWHPAVAASLKRRLSASERMKVERGALFPTINLRGETGVEYTNSPITRGRATRGANQPGSVTLQRNEVKIIIDQLIFDGWSTLNKVRAARAQLHKAGHEVVETRQTIALRAVAAHIDLARRTALVRIARENVAAHQSILSGLNRRVAAGISTSADLDEARARQAKAVATLRARIGDLRQAEVRYAAVTGLRPPAAADVPGLASLPAKYRGLSIRQALNMAYRRNPKLLMARSEVKSRRYSLKATRGLFVPKVNFEFTGAYGNNVGGILGSTSDVRALLMFHWNLYRGGADRARRREALANLFAARYDEADARRIVRERVRQSQEALLAAASRIDPLSEQVSAARRVILAYAKQFQAGQRSLLDRLDAQNELFLARSQRADAYYTALFNFFSKVAATGSLLAYFHEARDPQALLFGRAEDSTWKRRARDAKRVSKVDEAEYRRVFDRLLKDPGNIELNILYAQLAEQRGEYGRAIAAYQRVLTRDPRNRFARRALARLRYKIRPNTTQMTLATGVSFESNPHRNTGREGIRSDVVFDGKFAFKNERRLGDLVWRTNADLYANGHVHFRSLDFGLTTVGVGPIIPTYRGFNIRPFVGAGYSWYDGETFFAEPRAGVQVESTDKDSFFRSFTFSFAYDFVGSAFANRDAYRFEFRPIFAFPAERLVPGFGLQGTRLVVAPYYAYNGVTTGGTGLTPQGEPFPLRFHQIGATTQYQIPVASNLVLAPNVTVEYRHFMETVVNGTKRRRDLFIAPGAKLVLAGLFRGKADLIFSYAFRQNLSTDQFEEYGNHVASVKLFWRF